MLIKSAFWDPPPIFCSIRRRSPSLDAAAADVVAGAEEMVVVDVETLEGSTMSSVEFRRQVEEVNDENKTTTMLTR